MASNDTNSVVMELEGRLRRLLDAESAPIMSPCLESIRVLEPDILEHRVLKAIRNDLQRGNEPVRMIVSCLRQWPAISVLLLTSQVNESYTSENRYAVHRAIENLIGAQEPLSDGNRRKVWQEFRYACYKIGLKTTSRDSGVGFMTEEFLHQAGLPLAFVERVTEQMIRTAGEAGLAEEDDPEGLARWQERLLWHSRYLNPTTRHALESDETFYYTRIFLRASAGTAIAASDKTAVGIMAKVLAESSSRSRSGWRRILRIPRLLWRSDELVVEIPAGDDQEWKITVDECENIYRGEAAAESIPILTGHSQSGLPRTVVVENNDFQREYTLWEDQADNRFLIFNSGGQWLRGSALGADSLTLAPGTYSLVLRFEPSNSEEDICQVGYDPALFLQTLTLEPGQEYLLRRGPAEVCLRAERKPWMRFKGEQICPYSGEEVFYGCRLCLDLILGEKQDATLLQREDGEAEARRYELRFESGGREIARIPASEGTADVGEVLQKLSPGLHRLVAELRPAGTERAIVRSSIYYWAGFDRRGSDGVLHFTKWPQNLETLACEHICPNTSALTLGPLDPCRSTFRTEFRTPLGRTIGLEWLVPGVFLELADYAVAPVLRHRLDVGTSLAASPMSRQVLQIRSTEVGRLLLDGNEIKQVRAGQSISLNLSGVAERLATGTGTLVLVTEYGRSTKLARFVAPHQILSFSQDIVRQQCLIEMRFAAACSEVRCCAEDILTGATLELTALCDDPEAWSEESILRLESRDANQGVFSYLLTVETPNLPSGAWFFDFEVRLAGRWGAPTNPRQDTFAIGILIRDSRPTVSLNAVLGRTTGPDNTNALLERFCQVNAKLQRCFAPECWVGLSWLKVVWERWLSAIEPLDPHKTSELIRLCGTKPPESAAISWLPVLRLEAAMPSLFAQPARMYASIYRPSTGLGRCLSAIARLERPLVHFPAHMVHSFVAVGFGLERMIANKPPAAFDFGAYRQVLLSSPLPQSFPRDWLPGDSELLGRVHYQASWERMRDRYRETLSGNDARRQHGMRLCREVERKEQVQALCLRRLERKFDEGESVEEGLLHAIECFLSLLAKKCREDSCAPGALADYQRRLQLMLATGDDSFPLSQIMSLVLQLGGDLFAFYLLLWELVLAGTASRKEDVSHG